MDDPSPIGAALRAWRNRVTPEEVGLPAGARRRTPGLRREELASLAGVSVDYLTRLEQGRATSPSAQMVDALSRALRLADGERDDLYQLAGHAAPRAGLVSRHLSPGAQRLLDRLVGVPVGVYDAMSTIITANRLFLALHGDVLSGTEHERNLTWRHFTDVPSRVAQTPEQAERFDRVLVTDLRRVAVQYPEDRRVHDLIADLRAASPRFVEIWDSHVVTLRTTTRKTVHHPEVGPLELDCDVLRVEGSDAYLVAYTAAPGTEEAEKLRLLDVIGTQALSGPAPR